MVDFRHGALNFLGVRLQLFGSSQLLLFPTFVGAALIVIGSALAHRNEAIADEGLRWMLWIGASGVSIGLSVLLVELAAPQIEVRFFSALMAMPSSWALYKSWLWTMCIYLTFNALWDWSDLGLSPDEPMTRPARVVERLLTCMAVFMCVTLVLVVASKILVSFLYSQKHSHKVMSALAQESILADLAACVAPQRKSEQLPPELAAEDSFRDIVAPLPPGAYYSAAASPDADTSGGGGSGHGPGHGGLQSPLAAIHGGLTLRRRMARQISTNARVVLADGLTSGGELSGGGSAGAALPALGLPRLTTALSKSPSAAIRTMPSMRPRRFHPELGMSMQPARTRTQTGAPVHSTTGGAAESQGGAGADGTSRGASMDLSTRATEVAILAMRNLATRPSAVPHGSPRNRSEVGHGTSPPVPSIALEMAAAAAQLGRAPSGMSGLLQGWRSASHQGTAELPSPHLSQPVRRLTAGAQLQPPSNSTLLAAAGPAVPASGVGWPGTGPNAPPDGLAAPATLGQSPPVGGGLTESLRSPTSQPQSSVWDGGVSRRNNEGRGAVAAAAARAASEATEPSPERTASDASANDRQPALKVTSFAAMLNRNGSDEVRVTARPAALQETDEQLQEQPSQGRPSSRRLAATSIFSFGHGMGGRDRQTPGEELGRCTPPPITLPPLPDSPEAKHIQIRPSNSQSEAPPVPDDGAHNSASKLLPSTTNRRSVAFAIGAGCRHCLMFLPRLAMAAVAWARGVADGQARQLRELRRVINMQDAGTVHVRRTLVQALYLQYQLAATSEVAKVVSMEADAAAVLRAAHAMPQAALETWGAGGDGAGGGPPDMRAVHSAPAMVMEPPSSPPGLTEEEQVLHAQAFAAQLPPPNWLRLTSPRRLLDELLSTYRQLTDGELSVMAQTYAAMVLASVCPANETYITRQDLLDMNIAPEGVQVVWDLFDKDHDDRITGEDLRATALQFYQQRRNLALTIHAMRNLTLSIQVAMVIIVNLIFLMVVYLSILDVANLFSSGKSSLDFFTAYIVVVSFLFGEMIRSALGGALLLLAQQPFDIGEELVLEEAIGWRLMGVIQDFNLMFLRIKKSTDGELVTIPISKVFSTRFTNLSRSDWKIESNQFAVDITTPHAVLQAASDAALAHIRAHPGEYDVEYGFAIFYHGIERPNKVVLRTLHRFRFNLSAPVRRIAKAREGIIMAVLRAFQEHGVTFVELRKYMNVPPIPPELLDSARAPPHGGGPASAVVPPELVPPYPHVVPGAPAYTPTPGPEPTVGGHGSAPGLGAVWAGRDTLPAGSAPARSPRAVSPAIPIPLADRPPVAPRRASATSSPVNAPLAAAVAAAAGGPPVPMLGTSAGSSASPASAPRMAATAAAVAPGRAGVWAGVPSSSQQSLEGDDVGYNDAVQQMLAGWAAYSLESGRLGGPTAAQQPSPPGAK